MKILIADDHAILRKGLKEILLEQYPSAFIEEVGDADSLFKKSITSEWDVVITDLSMPGRSGLEALREIKQHSPKMPILVLSIYPEDQYATRVLKAGASGYINKDAAPTELVKAVQKVLLGRKYITPTIAEKLANDLGADSDKAPHELLTDREFDVMKMLASGRAIIDIADTLSLSPTTISTYRSRILEKMNLKSNADLTKYALQNKLI
ncbi:MAG TPA: response regulator transcription factor [Puia sp.]|nr:response regulator transcription factor [Puia sp.]